MKKLTFLSFWFLVLIKLLLYFGKEKLQGKTSMKHIRCILRDSRESLIHKLQSSTRKDEIDPIRLTRRCGEASMLVDEFLKKRVKGIETQLLISQGLHPCHVFIRSGDLVIDPTWLQFAPTESLRLLNDPNKLSCFVGSETLLWELCSRLGISNKYWNNTSLFIPKVPQISAKQMNTLMRIGTFL